jgi:hypothetical protein
MVDLSPEYVIESTLSVGTIYKFTAPELIETTIPHYFIVVAMEDTDNYLVLCTTKKDKKIEHFEKNMLDFTCLVYIKPDNDNNLTSDTYVNCYDYYTISKSSLIEKVKSNSFECTGKISLDHFTQIKNGIISNKVNDLPDYLLVYPE